MLSTIDTIYFYDIPIGTLIPSLGYRFQHLMFRTGYRDLLSVPNGIQLIFIGKYMPGFRFSFYQQIDGIDLIAVKDFAILAIPPIQTHVVGEAGETVYWESTPCSVLDVPEGYWDALILVLNLRPGFSWPVNLIDEVESARASLIVRNVFEIVSA